MKQAVKRRQTPAKIQSSPHLHVAAHKHTGHVLPRRHTSYPTLVMIMLCVGVLLAGWTRVVTADPTYGPAGGSYAVSLSVPGPAPTQPATIDAVNDRPIAAQMAVTAQPVKVSGSCPVNTYEKLFRNNVFSGVVLCSASGAYEIETGLFPANNQLQVQDFSFTDVPGPLSNLVNVTYSPPSPPATVGSTSTVTVNPAEPLVLKTNFKFQGYYHGQNTPWAVDIEGGQPPYAIAVDWGDGNHDVISRLQAGTFNLTHTYQKAGGYKGSYPVVFSASDTGGSKTYLQLLSIINNPPAGAATAKPTIAHGSTPDWLRQVAHYIWPSYGVVLLMLISFWLGERREFHHLKARHLLARR
ncbi:MAG TPA: hypothetical protein VHB51_01985 [Candidatus Saccharimonadales bacterium]|nr:hypothetical protein [Candidatus Saccharimonadales bacterium]